MPSDLAVAWRLNHESNTLLFKAIPAAGLACRYSPRTRTVAAQFAHVHNVRVYHLEKRAGDLAAGLAAFARGAEPSRRELSVALGASYKAMAKFLDQVAEAGRVKSWNGPPATFLGYLCAHEAHHRGLILVSLRIGGVKLPKEVAYNLWYWSRKVGT